MELRFSFQRPCGLLTERASRPVSPREASTFPEQVGRRRCAGLARRLRESRAVSAQGPKRLSEAFLRATPFFEGKNFSLPLPERPASDADAGEGLVEFGGYCCRPSKGRGYYLLGSPRQETFWSFSFPGRRLNRAGLRPATQHSARRCEGLSAASLAFRSASQLCGGR